MSEKREMSKKRSKPKTYKKSTVRHTRAIQRDRSKRPVSAPSGEVISERLKEIVAPATVGEASYYQQLGLRSRILTLPVMMAVVLSLILRQHGGINELVRVIQTESILWLPPLVEISQQALSTRLRTLPSELFLRVLTHILPVLQSRAQSRQRPLLPEIAWVQARYTQVLAADGSTLDALLRKVGLLGEEDKAPLAGRMLALLDLTTRLPQRIWYESNAEAHDQRFWPTILGALLPGSLLIFDMGFTNFTVYAQLTALGVFFITRAKSNLVYQLERSLSATATLHDHLIWIGSGDSRQQLRLLEVLHRGKWYRYLTNDLDTARLPLAYAVALYWQRWRIEDAYAVIKRLLGLAYFWSGAQNAIEMQLWATWILYAVLVDLTDEIAQELKQPFAALSIEMVYRSLYFFTQAFQRGETDNLVVYLASKAKFLGILKRDRSDKPSILSALNLTIAQDP